MVFVDDARRHLQIYDTSHLYVFGDLNYRVSLKNPRHLSLEQFGDMLKKDHRELLVHDQLHQEITGARTLHGLSEGEITFPPSYKFKVGTDDYKVNTALASTCSARTDKPSYRLFQREYQAGAIASCMPRLAKYVSDSTIRWVSLI